MAKVHIFVYFNKRKIYTVNSFLEKIPRFIAPDELYCIPFNECDIREILCLMSGYDSPFGLMCFKHKILS